MARADPSDRRLAVFAPLGMIHDRNLLEIELPGQRRHHADAGFAFDVADFCGEDRGGMLGIVVGFVHAVFVDRAGPGEREAGCRRFAQGIGRGY